jgi:hypothetical protein
VIFRRRAVAKRRIHDYRKRYWGHDYTLTPDPNPVTARITGWGDGLRRHDLLVVPHHAGGACFYEIEQIEYRMDPSDMWSARCRFVPGSSKLGQKAAAALNGPAEFSVLSLTSWRVFSG